MRRLGVYPGLTAMSCRKAKLKLPLKSILKELTWQSQVALRVILEDSGDPVRKTGMKWWKVFAATDQAMNAFRVNK